MSMLDKAKEYAKRIADIDLQLQTGDVNFEQTGGQALGLNVTLIARTFWWVGQHKNGGVYVRTI